MYTISQKADHKVQEDLDNIIKIINKNISPISIILFGGFGKGEGSFEIIDGLVRPLNDYDLYVITHKKINNNYIEKIAMKCANTLNRGGEEFCENPNEIYDADRFFHIDLRQITINRLPYLKPMQRTYELKQSIVIYGEDVRDKIPDVKVPNSDAIRLLFNKLHHLLLSQKNDIRIKTIHIYKAYLDICAALLIFENNFASKYTERNLIFQNLDYPEQLKELVNWASEFRMQPVFNLDKLDEKWVEAQTWVLWTLKKIVTKTLSVHEENWLIIIDKMYKKLPYTYFAPYIPFNLFPAQYVLNYYFFRRALKFKLKLFRVLLRWRDAGIILGIAMVLYHIGEYKTANFYLNKLHRSSVNPRESLLKLYGIYYSQRII